jgi:hypothetical protein
MQWTLDQVKAHALWRGLTGKERRFFELLAENNLDDMAAVVGAFDLRPQSVQSRLNQVRGAQDTGFLYRAMMGFALPTREELAAALWQLASKTKDEMRKERCLRAAARILRYERKESPEEPGADEEPASGPVQSGPDLSGFKES